MKKLFTLFAIVLCVKSFANTKSDSLNLIWNNETQVDSIRCLAFHSIIWDHYIYNNPDTAFKLVNKLYYFAQKKRIPYWEYEAVNLQGLASFYMDRYRKALSYFHRYLDYQLSNQNASKVAGALHCNNLR